MIMNYSYSDVFDLSPDVDIFTFRILQNNFQHFYFHKVNTHSCELNSLNPSEK